MNVLKHPKLKKDLSPPPSLDLDKYNMRNNFSLGKESTLYSRLFRFFKVKLVKIT